MTEETHLKSRELYSQIAHLNSHKQRLLSGKISAVLITNNEDKCRRKIEYEVQISDEMAAQIKDSAIKECEYKLSSLQKQFDEL